MAILGKNILRGFFLRGKYPTEDQFGSMIDSMRHVQEPIPMNEVQGLQQELANIAQQHFLHPRINIMPHHKNQIQCEIKGLDDMDLQGYYFVLARKRNGKWVRFARKSKDQKVQNNKISNNDRPNPIAAANQVCDFVIDWEWIRQYFVSKPYSVEPNGWWSSDISCHLIRQSKSMRAYSHHGSEGDYYKPAGVTRFNIKARVELVEGDMCDSPDNKINFSGKEPILVSDTFTIMCAVTHSGAEGGDVGIIDIQIKL
jgi:hypothetical protein